MSSVTVVISPFFLLIFLIWILSLCPPVSLAKGLSVLLIFFKEPASGFVDCRVCFVSIWLISALSLIISCHVLLLGVFVPFSSIAFRCAITLLVYAVSSFILEALKVMSFPLSTDSIVSHNFGHVVPSFSLNSEKSLISFFLP